MILGFAGLLIGFILMIKGADFLIDGAVSLAIKFHISEIAIGLTIVAFGTSAPELIVNILSAIKGHPEICYGNVIGSNLFNTLMVLGITGLVSPIFLQKATVIKEIPFMFFGTILIIVLSNNFWQGGAVLSRLDGVLLFACLVLFLIYVMGIPKNNTGEHYQSVSTLKTILLIIFGIIGLFAGGEFVVRNAVSIAREFGVSEKLISLTIVAFGTSLPELVTSLLALKKKSSDIAVGNVIGSNLFNIFMVLGVTAMIKPIEFNVLLNIDLMILMVITIILFFLVCVGKLNKLNRYEAGLLVVIYFSYLGYLLNRG